MIAVRISKTTALTSISSTWRVPLVNRKHGEGLLQGYLSNTTAIWPHELFVGLFHFHHSGFDKHILGGNSSNIQDLWTKMPPQAW